MEHLYKVSFSDAEVDSCLKEANTDSKVNSADPHPFTAFGGMCPWTASKKSCSYYL